MTIPEISVEEAATRLAGPQPPQLIDVREADEWAVAHVAGAELVPLSEWPGVVPQKLVNPAQPLLILCHHGSRSARATEFLLRIGFADVTNVAGGIDAWSLRVDPGVARY
ncbi:MAG: rhodanese-like domain protein [Chthoniobacter sp.]|jgi:rhodanese-related sulfurtransferase|nr:rhodanese-like domain protein [Chthoniobacter sp.]